MSDGKEARDRADRDRRELSSEREALTHLRDIALLRAAKEGDDQRVAYMLRQGANINCHDPANGATVLHYAASRQARRVLKIIIREKNLDFLVHDFRGRLPSDLAYEFGSNAAISRYLLRKEIQQARRQGIDYPPAVSAPPSEGTEGLPVSFFDLLSSLKSVD